MRGHTLPIALRAVVAAARVRTLVQISGQGLAAHEGTQTTLVELSGGSRVASIERQREPHATRHAHLPP
jgi:hypothetical protein